MSDDKVIPPENQSMSFHQEEQESHHRITDEARRLVADFHQFAVQLQKEQLIGNRPQDEERRLRALICWLEKNVQKIVDIRRHRKYIPDHQSREEYLLDLQQQLLTLRAEVLQRLQEENIIIHPPERDFSLPHEPQELRLRGDIIKEDVERFSVEAHKDYTVVLSHWNDKKHIQELENSLWFIVDHTDDPGDILLVASIISHMYKQQGEKGYQRARAFMQEIILPRIESLGLPPQQKQKLVHHVRLFEYGLEVIFNKVQHIEHDFQDLLQNPLPEVLASYLYKRGDWQKASKALVEAIPVLQKRYEQYKNKGDFHHALETLLRLSRFMTYLAITSFKMGHDRNVSEYLQASILMTQGTTKNEVDIMRSRGNNIFQQLFDPHITRDQLQSFEQQYREMLAIYKCNDAHEMKVRTLLNLAIIAYKQAQWHRDGEMLDQGGYPCHKTKLEHLQDALGILEQSHQIIRDRGFSYLLQECLNYKSLVLFELGHCEKKEGRVEAGEEKINKAKKINRRAVRFSLPQQGGDIFIRQDLQEQYILTHLIRIYQQYAEKMDSEESQREIADQLAQFLRVLFREDLYTYEHTERVGDLLVKHFYLYLKALGESCEEHNGSWTLQTLDPSALASIYQHAKEYLFTRNQAMYDTYQSVFIDQYHTMIEYLRPYVQQYGPVWQTYRSLNPAMLRMMALYHDIGKIGLPLDILNKPGELLEQERMVINMHPIYGVRILDRLADVLQKFPIFEHLRRVCLQHHERFNGQGYPHQLKGMQIDILAQMMLLVDVFDAKSHPRVYRKQSYSPRDNSQHIQHELQKENPQYSPLWGRIFIQQLDFLSQSNLG